MASPTGSIRQRVAWALIPKDDRILREAGVLDLDSGVLNEQGRRVVIDILFEDKDLRKEVVSRVKATLPKKGKDSE